MAIRIKVLKDRTTELLDISSKRWYEYDDISKAFVAAARILRRRIEEQRKEQCIGFRVQ